jgi:CheY-like chemotaxis protein
LLEEAGPTRPPYDAVILDQMMPGMSGLDVARAMKKIPWAAAIPIILASSDGSEELRRDARSVGVAATVMKPIRCHYLLEHLSRSTGLSTALMDGPTTGGPTTPRVTASATPSRLLTILLAEDNLINQQVAVRRLQKLGHSVEIANNGVEAVNALKAKNYDLILMDVQMPEMDGFEATAAIRAMPGDKHRIPIIAMTANALPSDCERCLAAGMDDYIAKPVHQHILVELIEKWGAIGYASAHPRLADPASDTTSAEAGGQTAEVDLLDIDGIKELIEVLGLEVYRDLAAQFFDSHDATTASLNAAAADGDYVQIDRLAHSLKGAAANLGLLVLADHAAALRSREEASGAADLPGMLNAIEAMLHRSRRQLLSLLDGLPTELADTGL